MLQGLLEQVKNAIFNDPTTPHREGFDPSGLIGNIEGLFGRHQEQMGTMQNPISASQDPYGDPADAFPAQAGGGYAYADNGRMGNVRPASEDPYGDPADLERR